MKALIVIDYTYDFVADDGKLSAGKPAQDIEEKIAEVTQEAFDQGDYIFFAVDCHEETDQWHPEAKLFPAHSLKGTRGRCLYGALADVYDKIKGNPNVCCIDKRYYSAFSGTDLDIRLRERDVNTLVLSGLLTDICVLHTAIDAYNLGYHLEVISTAVASLSKTNDRWVLRHFEQVLGATLVEA